MKLDAVLLTLVVVFSLGCSTNTSEDGNQVPGDADLQGDTTPDVSLETNPPDSADETADTTGVSDDRDSVFDSQETEDDGPVIRLIYLVPSDRTEQASYITVLESAARHLQRFYLDEMGNGKTFRLHDPVVEVFTTTHTAEWYSRNIEEVYGSWDDAMSDGTALTGGGFNDPENLWVFYIDADNGCGQAGGAAINGVAVLPANDLRGLAGEELNPTCPDDPPFWYDYPPCRWVGGLGHELGHAFGLPHPPGCDDGLPTCDEDALMWTGVYIYPDTYLRNEEQSVLDTSPFFDVRVAVPTFDCDEL